MIAAAIVALIQLGAVRSGKPSPIAAGVTSVAAPAQSGVSGIAEAVSGFFGNLSSLPQLSAENQRLASDNERLRAENNRLQEAVASAPEAAAVARLTKDDPADIAATVIGFDPENESRTITIDRGFQSGVAVDDGVIAAGGIVGHVIEVEPLSSKVLLAIDISSKIPAVVQRSREFALASGTNSRMQLRFVSQDAKLKIGDVIVTGGGRAFHDGLPIGRITKISHPEGALYQTAALEPAVAFSRLHHVLVVPH